MRAGLLALALLVPGAKAFWPFKKERFTAETLLDAGSLGLDPAVGRIAAIGDVNGDQK
jgi:integrin alpha FG-GAP repeat containing protein 1